MKQHPLELVPETSTAESVYAEKYEWLMRWALHFCNGDREMAEDLVQDTFVRMISSWDSIRKIENPEKFLYTYLKYGFLRLRAADKRKAMHSVPVEELDALDRKLPETASGILEWQQDIKIVVQFLCWRKTTAKSASLLLLRFFHGLFPAEIMQVARATRKAVDDGLASARHEARKFVNGRSPDPDTANRFKMRTYSQSVPHVAVPMPSTEEFMRQMLASVFAAKSGACLSASSLMERYDPQSNSTIDTWLLSHIVSCARCLDLVLEAHGLPPCGARPLEDILGYAPKGEGTKSKRTPGVKIAMRSIVAAKAGYRNSLEKRLSSMELFVDGQQLASRDIGNLQNELTVDLRSGNHPELVEVAGDGVPLLSVPMLFAPPNVPPVQVFHAKLTEGRNVALTFEFHASKLRLRVTYSDLFLLDSPGGRVIDFVGPDLSAMQETERKVADEDQDDWLVKITRWFSSPLQPWVKVGVGLACLGLVCVPIYRRLRAPQPEAVLAQAVEATRHQTAGVVTQKVRVTSRGRSGSQSYDTTLHRDLSHKLIPRYPARPAIQAGIEHQLATLRITWNDPLSPSNFRDWREQQNDAKDSVVEESNGLLTLRSQVPTGLVREESLTLDAAYHAVARTVRFQNREEIEIAELDYKVIAPAESDPAWFEAVPSVSASIQADRPSLLTGSRRSAVTNPTPEQMDVAELNVRLAMIELQADGRERLSIRRRKDGIHVDGLVATDERKREIEARLRQLLFVSSSIETFTAFEVSSRGRTEGTAGSSGDTPLAVVSATDHLSPLDGLSSERHLSVEQLGAIHSSLLEAAVELRRTATAMQDLDQRFQVGGATEDSKKLRSSLMQIYAARLKTAATKETGALRGLGITESSAAIDLGSPIWSIALENARLCFELISQQTEDVRPAKRFCRNLLLQDSLCSGRSRTHGERLKPP